MNNTEFLSRHIGSSNSEVNQMLEVCGCSSLDELIDQVVPSSIRLARPLNVGAALSEHEYLNYLSRLGAANKLNKNYIGQGYYGAIMPSVIKRNILENASWYTSYTPYQAEISQGRLEALFNYQTVICNLTGMAVSNASLLDEATSAAEAMLMFYNGRPKQLTAANTFFIDKNTFRQTIDVVTTRAEALGLQVVVDDFRTFAFTSEVFGALVQYPNAIGTIETYANFVTAAHATGACVAVAADLMSLALLTPPSEWGADVVLGSTQRFGLPMGFGGPHAGFFATKEAFIRRMPGRIIGKSIDAQGNPAFRMTLQTREQHIKREKATSNICTSQALLANMSGMYAVYHGKEGLQAIARRIHGLATALGKALQTLGFNASSHDYFDTIAIKSSPAQREVLNRLASKANINLFYGVDFVCVSIDECTTKHDILQLVELFAELVGKDAPAVKSFDGGCITGQHIRTDEFLQAEVFRKYRTETELMRYIKSLENKDISLTHSMIALGSCTMKLNSATSMLPLSWDTFGGIHPFVSHNQSEGYGMVIEDLGIALCKITGFAGISFQPNSGAAGEYAGLLVIRNYHHDRGERQRNIILIPSSAHGTNPASAIMAGFQTVTVSCDANGNIDMDDLRTKAEANKEKLAGLMVTYPSTHGVFEEDIMDIDHIVHQLGGLVYMDGANMNAQVGLTNPATIGADICHLNLHKTFGIPHGGGGPGVGPVLVRAGLEQYLPGHFVQTAGSYSSVSAAPHGSANVLLISHAYIKMLGDEGLTMSTKMAILNANYLAAALKQQYSVLYTGKKGRVAHEMILDCREFKKAGIEVGDIAKRLMDYGFHAPTVSFPVAGTLMVEPTESESLAELNRFVEAMTAIRNEIAQVESGAQPQAGNVLKNAPHTAAVVMADEWTRPYSRSTAAFPLPWVAANKYWPTVSRIDDAYGDRNLVCSCSC